jgi:hypothetical protein
MKRERFPKVQKFIKVNGLRIYLDVAALRNGGELKSARDHEQLTEQCDGCGGDIMETGSLTNGRTVVVCDRCNEHFPITTVEAA